MGDKLEGQRRRGGYGRVFGQEPFQVTGFQYRPGKRREVGLQQAEHVR
jgi:hypothetical protein